MAELKLNFLSDHYKNAQKIAQGTISTLYLLKDDSPSRIVKLLEPMYVSSRIEDFIRLKKEAMRAAGLNHPGIVPFYSVEQINGQYLLEMDYIPGKNLEQLIASEQNLAMKTILDIACQLAEILLTCHEQGLLHKDLKPSNIILTDNKKVRISDFGLAHIKKYTSIKEPEKLLPTYSCMAPEQCGIVKKNTDERSDLYALGVICYQLVTGEVPFTGPTLSQLIHQHIAQKPAPPSYHNPSIPLMFEKLILKLLEKDQDDRYQTAQGVLADLNRIKTHRESFVLGEHDHIKKLTFQTGLVGRQTEQTQINQQLEQAWHGSGSILLIGAESGQGKTRLVEECRSKIQLKNKHILQSKFFASHHTIPYAAIKEILDNYISIFQKYESAQQQAIQTQLREGVGNLGQIVLDVNPEAKILLGDCPALHAMSPEDDQKRFIATMAHFILTLSKVENGLVVFFDDLQWADNGSLAILYELAQDIGQHAMMVLGTYRSDEITSDHPLHQLLSLKDSSIIPFTLMTLNAFTLKEIRNLIIHIIHEQPEGLDKLAETIYHQGKGNPFFTIEILKQLHAENIIYHQTNRWQIDMAKLQETVIPKKAVDIIIQRMKRLTTQEKYILSIASVIGRAFRNELLFNLIELEPQEIIDVVDHAVEMQLLEQDMIEQDKITFAHDRITQAFYDTIDPQLKIELHRKVALALEKQHQAGLRDNLFDLAFHFTVCQDDNKILHYNYPAGIKAKNKYANVDAIRYLEAAIAVLDNKRAVQATHDAERWIKAHVYLAEIKLLIGQYDESIKIHQQLLALISDKVIRAKCYERLCLAFLKKGEFAEQEKVAAQFFREAGQWLPLRGPVVIFSLVLEILIHLLHEKFPKLFKGRRQPEHPEQIESMLSASHSLAWGYIFTDLLKYLRNAFFGLNLSEKTSIRMGRSTTMFGSLLFAIGKFDQAKATLQRAIAINHQENNEWGVAEAQEFAGFAHQFSGEFNKANQYFNRAITTFKRIGDTREYFMSLNGIMKSNLYLAALDTMPQLVKTYRENAYRTQNHYNIASSYINGMRTAYTQGHYQDALTQGLQGYDHAKQHQLAFLQCKLCFMLGEVYLELNQLPEAREKIMESLQLYESHHFLKNYTVYVYNYVAELLIQEYRQLANAKLSGQDQSRMLRAIKQACHRAIQKNKKWPVSFGGSLRVMANYYTLINQPKKAKHYFLASINHHKRLNRNYEQARTHYDYGCYLFNQDMITEATVQLQSAFHLFKQVNSIVYLERIKEIIDINESSAMGSEKIIDQQRLSSIIDVSQSISSILDLNQLIEAVVKQAVTVTGAQRGYLFLVDHQSNELIEMTGSGNTSLSDEPQKLGVSWSLVKQAYQDNQAIMTSHACEDERFKTFTDIQDQQLKSILVMPLHYQQKTIGICYLDNTIATDVFNSEDVSVLNVLMTQAAISIENAALTKDMVEKKRLEREMELAQQIQTAILPKNFENPHLEIAGLMQPADEFGGDYIDYMLDKQQREWFFIGDVTGHGVTPGLIMMMAQAMANSLVHHQPITPKELIQQLNFTLFDNIKNRLQVNEYMTFVAICHQGEGRFNYAGAHESLLIYRQTSHSIEEINVTGPWLGIKSNIHNSTQSGEFELAVGDILILYTDGVVEARNEQKECFQVSKLKELLLTYHQSSCQDLLASIVERTRHYMLTQEDDLSLMAIRRLT